MSNRQDKPNPRHIKPPKAAFLSGSGGLSLAKTKESLPGGQQPSGLPRPSERGRSTNHPVSAPAQSAVARKRQHPSLVKSKGYQRIYVEPCGDHYSPPNHRTQSGFPFGVWGTFFGQDQRKPPGGLQPALGCTIPAGRGRSINHPVSAPAQSAVARK